MESKTVSLPVLKIFFINCPHSQHNKVQNECGKNKLIVSNPNLYIYIYTKIFNLWSIFWKHKLKGRCSHKNATYLTNLLLPTPYGFICFLLFRSLVHTWSSIRCLVFEKKTCSLLSTLNFWMINVIMINAPTCT